VEGKFVLIVSNGGAEDFGRWSNLPRILPWWKTFVFTNLSSCLPWTSNAAR